MPRKGRQGGPRGGRGRAYPALLLAIVVLFAALLAQGRAQVTGSAPASTSVSSGGASTPEAHSPEKNQSEANEDDAYRHSSVVKFLGSKLGMSTDQAASAFEIFNFIVLAIFIGWMLLKILPKTFRDRTSSLQKRLVEARAATEEANARMSNVEGRLGALNGEIAALRAQAEKDLANEEIRVRAAIEEERAKILAATEQEIAAISAQARREIRQYAAELAVDQAAKKLVVSAETDRLLVQEFAKRLTGKTGEAN